MKDSSSLIKMMDWRALGQRQCPLSGQIASRRTLRLHARHTVLVRASTEHFADSKVKIEGRQGAEGAQAAQDAEAGTVMFAIPQTHLLSLDQVRSVPALNESTKGAMPVRCILCR